MRKTARQTFCVTLDLLATVIKELKDHAFDSIIARDEADDFMTFMFYKFEQESLVLVQDTDLLARGTNWVNLRSPYGGISFPEQWDSHPREAMSWSGGLPSHIDPAVTETLKLKQVDKTTVEDFRNFVKVTGHKGIVDLMVFSQSDYTNFVGYGIKKVLNALKGLDIKCSLAKKIETLKINMQNVVGGLAYIQLVIDHFNNKNLNRIHESCTMIQDVAKKWVPLFMTDKIVGIAQNRTGIQNKNLSTFLAKEIERVNVCKGEGKSMREPPTFTDSITLLSTTKGMVNANLSFNRLLPWLFESPINNYAVLAYADDGQATRNFRGIYNGLKLCNDNHIECLEISFQDATLGKRGLLLGKVEASMETPCYACWSLFEISSCAQTIDDRNTCISKFLDGECSCGAGKLGHCVHVIGNFLDIYI